MASLRRIYAVFFKVKFWTPLSLDLFVRIVISHHDRELATIAALANMTGFDEQLRFHLAAEMNTGLTEKQMKDFISVLATGIDRKNIENAGKILDAVLDNRK